MSTELETALEAFKVAGNEYLIAQAKMISLREAATKANDDARAASHAFDKISTAYSHARDDLARALNEGVEA